MITKLIPVSELSGFERWWKTADPWDLYFDIRRHDDDGLEVASEAMLRFAQLAYVAGRRSVQSELSKKRARRRPPGR
jgi:hypothetical protein